LKCTVSNRREREGEGIPPIIDVCFFWRKKKERKKEREKKRTKERCSYPPKREEQIQFLIVDRFILSNYQNKLQKC
jgi:hypothetical protein